MQRLHAPAFEMFLMKIGEFGLSIGRDRPTMNWREARGTFGLWRFRWTEASVF